MRHVILASNYPVGNEILRVLTSIQTHSVILGSASQTIPQGIDPNRVEVHYASVLDPFSLMDLFAEGDIVYNSQVVVDENANLGELNLYNIHGLRNVLAVAAIKKVTKVVTVLPQTLGWSVPLNATEKTPQAKPSRAHEIFIRSLNICSLYNEGKKFGWDDDELSGYVPFDPNASTKISENVEDSSQKSAPSTGPSLGGPKAPSGPSTGPSLGGPKAPSGPITGPTLGDGSTTKTQEADNDSIEEQTIQTDENTAGIKEENQEASEEELDSDISELDHVPLTIARMARLFGPFDKHLTVDFCRHVRLQKIKVVGRLKKPISWINPIDAGRAMVFLGDQTVPKGEYNIVGFTATANQLLKSLAKANYSGLRIRRTALLFSYVKYKLSQLLGLIGIKIKSNYTKYKALNVPQVFSDEKAREEWGWEPKYDLDESSKDAMDWFIEYILDLSNYKT